jgi:hypothetical protein
VLPGRRLQRGSATAARASETGEGGALVASQRKGYILGTSGATTYSRTSAAGGKSLKTTPFRGLPPKVS